MKSVKTLLIILAILFVMGIAVAWFLMHQRAIVLPSSSEIQLPVLITQAADLNLGSIKPLDSDSGLGRAVELTSTSTKVFNGLFFGDLMLDRHVGSLVKQHGLDSLLKNIQQPLALLSTSLDMVSANLEGATTDHGAHYGPILTNDFAFDPVIVGQLKNYQFNFFNLANNHLTDQGVLGVTETRKNLTKLGYDYSGCADRQLGDCSSKLLLVNGLKVEMIGFSLVYGPLDVAQARAIVTKVKARADFVLINIHWGQEYNHVFSEAQSQLAHTLVDAGADAIIGAHPHVVQGLEIYHTKPIFYSLGNLIFDQYFSEATQQGLAIRLALTKHQIQATILPLQEKMSSPKLLEGNEKATRLIELLKWSKLTVLEQAQLKTGVLIINQTP